MPRAGGRATSPSRQEEPTAKRALGRSPKTSSTRPAKTSPIPTEETSPTRGPKTTPTRAGKTSLPPAPKPAPARAPRAVPRTVSTPPRPREDTKRDKRERIAEAAWELFSIDGFAGTTTKAVADRAGVAAGTLFLYARDKEDLLCLVMHDRLAEATDRAFATMPQGEPFEARAFHVFNTFLDVYASNPAVGAPFVRALVGAHGPNGQKVNALTFGFLHRLSVAIREAQSRGEVGAGIEPFLAAQNLFCLYTGALLGWASGFVSLDAARDPGLRLSIALAMRGLRPP